ncbi:MAG: transporter substrate-binding domain-containing protein [Sneathiella sp.]|nr:transporter substrate-binding domain-containing protein [Sneathiella sp.]
MFKTNLFSFRKNLIGLLLAPWLICSANAAEYYAADIIPTAFAKNGVIKGFAVEIMDEVINRLGYPEYNTVLLPAKRAFTEPKRNRTAILANLARSPSRENHYKWLFRLQNISLFYVTKKGHKSVTHENASKLRLVGVLGSAAVHEILNMHPKIRVHATQNEETNLRMLMADRIDAWFTSSTLLQGALKKETKISIKDLSVGVTVEKLGIYAAAGLNMPDTEVTKWRRAFDTMKKDGTYQAIMSKYFAASIN